MKIKIRESFAYYLPQYHIIEENNKWWGEGFTEWVNLKKSKKLHKNHEICYPGELGYYDLSDVNIVEKQYKLAKEYGISTFCFWHYWFADNDMLLEKVAENIIKSDVDVKFCFAWANHSWYNKSKGLLLKKQTYDFDYNKYFSYLLKFIKDARYTKIDNKPVFVIYRAQDIPDFNYFKQIFDSLAKKEGFDGFFWIGENLNLEEAKMYDMNLSLNSGDFLRYRKIPRVLYDKFIFKLQKIGYVKVRMHSYRDVVNSINNYVVSDEQIPIILPNWDSTIRHGRRGILLTDNNPEIFSEHVKQCAELLGKRDFEKRFVMIKSWNEWAEGNFIEPSSLHGRSYLKMFSDCFEL